MKHFARLLIAAYLATSTAGIGSGFATAADAGAVAQDQQDLVNVKASKPVISAVWKREPDSYTLQIVLDRYLGRAQPPAGPAQIAPGGAPVSPLTAEEMRRLGIVNAADALRQLVPQNIGAMPTPIPNWREPKAGATPADRSAFFIGNTIANLRGLDPAFAGALVTREGRVEVWLLKADGTHIPPATYNCVYSSRQPPAPNDIVSIWYGFQLVDGAQAVAAAIRIDGDFYIEKLQPLVAAPTVQ